MTTPTPWKRWTLTDPSGALLDFTLPINPNQMDPQQIGLTISTAGQGGFSDTQAPTQPFQWTFQGTLYTLDEITTLYDWLDLGQPVTLTDHWGYSFQVLLTGLDTVRGGKRRNPERHTYTVHALMLKQLGRGA